MKNLLFGIALFSLCAAAETVQMPAACTNPDGMAVDAKGRLVVAAPNCDRKQPGAVFLVDKPGDAPRLWFKVPLAPGAAYAQPMGVAFGPDGALYVCDCQSAGKGRLLRCTFKDDKLDKCETVAEGLDNANGVKWRDGKLYLTQAFLYGVKRADGAATSGLFMFSDSERNARPANRPDDPHCVFSDFTANPKIRGGLNGVAVDADGHLYVGNYGDGRVWKLTLGADGRVAKSEKIVDTGIVTPDGLCVDAKGRAYVADMRGDAAIRIAPDGKLAVLKRGGFARPSEPCVWRGKLYVANYGGTSLEVVPLAE